VYLTGARAFIALLTGMIPTRSELVEQRGSQVDSAALIGPVMEAIKELDDRLRAIEGIRGEAPGQGR